MFGIGILQNYRTTDWCAHSHLQWQTSILRSSAGHSSVRHVKGTGPGAGGVFGLTDNDPESPVIRGLPPVLFTLMKSTEPWAGAPRRRPMPCCIDNGGLGY